MKTYVAEHGYEPLNSLRVGHAPAPTGGHPPVELLAAVPSEECGCPEELWRIDQLECLIHFEADGSSEAFIFAGDWEDERQFQARDMSELRAHLFAWVAEITANWIN